MDCGVFNDLKFLETLVRIKKIDPEIVHIDTKTLAEQMRRRRMKATTMRERIKRRAVKKERPLYLKDVNARHLIELGPEFEDEPLKYDSKVYSEEQTEGIEAFLEAEKATFDSVDEEDDILKVKAGEAWTGSREG